MASRAKWVCNLKKPRIWYVGDHDGHCKKLSIALFKQISLSIRWKTDNPFVHLKVSGSKICMSLLDRCSFQQEMPVEKPC